MKVTADCIKGSDSNFKESAPVAIWKIGLISYIAIGS
jgi:hypothetical protein